MTAHAIEVAKRRRQQDVGARAAGEQEAGDVRMLADEILRGRRKMVVVERIDLGTMVEQNPAISTLAA